MSARIRDTEPARLAERRRAVLAVVAGCAAGAAIGALAGGALLAAAGAVLALLPLRRLVRGAPGIPVLTYHSVSAAPGWLPWAEDTSIRPETLDRQLRLFARMGLRCLPSLDMVRHRKAGLAAAADAVVLHFDDGYLDTRVAAWPILRRHGAVATLFVSTDFIAPGEALRPTIEETAAPQWDGYLTWPEIRALDASPEFTVESHGTDHGRVVTGPATVGRITGANIDRLAWIDWAEMPGPKHDWYTRAPRFRRIGGPVPESAPALAAQHWSLTRGVETEEAYADRVRGVLEESRTLLGQGLGRAPALFCWPENATNGLARGLAEAAGYAATTGGRGRNTVAGDARVIGRLHVGQDYAGFRCGVLDDLALRAQLRCFQGDLIWAPVVAGIGLLRRAVRLAVRLAPRRRGAVPSEART